MPAGAPPRATRSAPVAWALCARARAASLIAVSRSALRARRRGRCAPFAPGRAAAGCQDRRLALYALGADGMVALRARAPAAARSRPRAARSAPMAWALRARAAGACACAPADNARVASWWWGCRCRSRRALCADRDAWCKARFALLPRARVGGSQASPLITMHERAGERLRATAACAV